MELLQPNNKINILLVTKNRTCNNEAKLREYAGLSVKAKCSLTRILNFDPYFYVDKVLSIMHIQ